MKTNPETAKHPESSYFDKIHLAMVALDLTEVDESVLRYLAFLSGQLSVETLYFCHVVPKVDSYDPFFFKDVETMDGYFMLSDQLVEALKDKVQSTIPHRPDMAFQYEIVAGEPLDELLRSIEYIKPELLVIGKKKGEEGHGTLARNLIREITRAALVVPEKAKPVLKRMLVPVDFSENSARALEAAMAINEQLDEPAEIVALHVYKRPNMSAYKIEKSRAQFQEIVEENMREAFRMFVDQFRYDPKNVAIELVEKDLPGTARYIVEYAYTSAIDLVVIGAKGHSKVERLLLGSITEKFLHLNDRIPLLVVK